ncbi:odorant receptor [Triplophysa rosa]|uniref:Odorant receptor n=1 Tax=Triplophysa rosa TaxID=992332 RepID=A0A9W7TL62_TRIRA|nr:odorant receptor [Triplophysa rosa]
MSLFYVVFKERSLHEPMYILITCLSVNDLYGSVFERLGHMRYASFSLGFVLYCVIIFLNALIILAVCLERTLHQPMYILISCLSINSVYGTAAFFPRVLTDLLSNTNIISFNACLLQTFVIFSYTANEFAILMLMAFDRFVAISKPLEYHNIITLRVLTALIVIHCTFPMFCLSISVLLTSRLKMCDNKLWKVYCHNYEIVKLSCANTLISNIWGILLLIVTCVVPLILILYSYVRILIVCHRSSSHLPQGTRNFMALEFLVIPPILNPLIYGLNLTTIRKQVMQLFFKKQVGISE